jgi:DNA-binding response OmpR family regulator
MTLALICSQKDLEAELGQTLLWRAGFDRYRTSGIEEARRLAGSNKPDIVVVDRDFPSAARLVASLRESLASRHVSIVVVAPGDFDALEVELLEAGANAIFRLPPGPDWDERLTRLIKVPTRRNARLPLSFKVDASVSLEPGPLPATAVNISETGLLLETRMMPLQVGDELQLEIQLDGDEDQILRVEGRVVRQGVPGQFGVEFLSLDASLKTRIKAFVDSLETS